MGSRCGSCGRVVGPHTRHAGVRRSPAGPALCPTRGSIKPGLKLGLKPDACRPRPPTGPAPIRPRQAPPPGRPHPTVTPATPSPPRPQRAAAVAMATVRPPAPRLGGTVDLGESVRHGQTCKPALSAPKPLGSGAGEAAVASFSLAAAGRSRCCGGEGSVLGPRSRLSGVSATFLLLRAAWDRLSPWAAPS